MEADLAARRRLLQKSGLFALGAALCRQAVMHAALKTTQPFGSRWLARILSDILRMLYSSATGVKFTCNTQEAWHADPERRLDPERQYMMPWHPHGLLTQTAFFHTSRFSATSFERDHVGPKRWFVGVADLLFRFPVVGEQLMLSNARSVSPQMSDQLMQKGYSYSLQPGGINEQVLVDHRMEICVFPRNLGFVRLAIKYGAPLVPIYVYGENQICTTYGWTRTATRRIYEASGICIPLFNPIPNKIICHQRFGRPVQVGEPQADPAEGFVELIFAKYVKELMRMFEEYSRDCLPADVAARGLTFMWRGHSKEDLDDLLARHDVSLPESGHTEAGFGKPPALAARLPQLRSAL